MAASIGAWLVRALSNNPVLGILLVDLDVNYLQRKYISTQPLHAHKQLGCLDCAKRIKFGRAKRVLNRKN